MEREFYTVRGFGSGDVHILTMSDLDELCDPDRIACIWRDYMDHHSGFASPVAQLQQLAWKHFFAIAHNSRDGIPRTWNEMPEWPGIYALYLDYRRDGSRLDADCVQYIGMATNIRARWRTHQLRKLWQADAPNGNGQYWLAVKPFDTKNFRSLEHEEALYISVLNPPLNRKMQYRPGAVQA